MDLLQDRLRDGDSFLPVQIDWYTDGWFVSKVQLTVCPTIPDFNTADVDALSVILLSSVISDSKELHQTSSSSSETE
jgi:hypothetical protein